jgi:hypothetical protein
MGSIFCKKEESDNYDDMYIFYKQLYEKTIELNKEYLKLNKRLKNKLLHIENLNMNLNMNIEQHENIKSEIRLFRKSSKSTVSDFDYN